ncbi:radical SAM family heme chaperone HemW [Chloroflexota bacterium]
MSADIALYIHVPFCRRKCAYCSFVSYERCEADIPAYINTLKEELIWRAGGERVRSIYFGGGTPSLLSAGQVADILSTVDSLFIIDDAVEVTLEANPGTVDITYFADIRALGVNRLSIGVQSLNDGELELLGRIHRGVDAREALRFARDSGFDNLSVDLIYGLPGQRMMDWQNTLEEIIQIGPDHLSLYGLTVEAITPIAMAIEEKSLPSIDPDLSADQYELAEDLLAAHGYHHYEISNWARLGMECYHNTVYWQNLPYLGVGVAAHSCLGGHRLANTTDIGNYLQAFSNDLQAMPESDEEISPQLQLAETVILGLRMCRGVCLDDIRNRFGLDLPGHYSGRIEELVSYGLLEYNDRYIRLTRRGRLLSNEVLWRFLPD